MIKTHNSWNLLKPTLEEYSMWKFEEYYTRISSNYDFSNIPKEVFKQWIHWLHQNIDTLKNYSWINYRNVKFELISFKFNRLKKLHVVKNFRELVALRWKYTSYDDFFCNSVDKNYWIEKGTWRIPPIIFNVKSLKWNIPKESDINWDFQLIEWHNRLWYLFSMKRISRLWKWKISDSHLVYVMSNIN